QVVEHKVLGHLQGANADKVRPKSLAQLKEVLHIAALFGRYLDVQLVARAVLLAKLKLGAKVAQAAVDHDSDSIRQRLGLFQQGGGQEDGRLVGNLGGM